VIVVEWKKDLPFGGREICQDIAIGAAACVGETVAPSFEVKEGWSR